MAADSAKSGQTLGLDLLSGDDSFLNELSPEDQASISGGGRWRTRSRLSRPSRITRPSRPSPSDRLGGRRGGRRRGLIG